MNSPIETLKQTTKSLATSNWIRLACNPSVVRRGMVYSLVVGTLLAIINQGDVIMQGSLTWWHGLKIALTYLVPYAVSTLSSVGAMQNSVRS